MLLLSIGLVDNGKVKYHNMKNIFTPAFLEEIGFVLISFKDGYGKAIDKRTNGMTVLSWSCQGHHCTYFGEKLEPNISFGIRKDGDTRCAFNGYIFNQDDVRRLLKMTW